MTPAFYKTQGQPNDKRPICWAYFFHTTPIPPCPHRQNTNHTRPHVIKRVTPALVSETGRDKPETKRRGKTENENNFKKISDVWRGFSGDFRKAFYPLPIYPPTPYPRQMDTGLYRYGVIYTHRRYPYNGTLPYICPHTVTPYGCLSIAGGIIIFGLLRTNGSNST